MPRLARIDYPGALQHVIARGIERKYIFKHKEDKEEFYARLKSILEKSSIKCYAWSIMDNHFHLLLQTGKTSLAEFMRRLLTSYALYYNKKYKRVGHLFQNRYKSVVCNKDAYLLQLVRYIHLNPVKAKLITIKMLESYIWTGHKELIEGEVEILEREELLGYFSKREKAALEGYKKFVKEGVKLKEDYEGGGLIRSAGGLKEVIGRRKEDKELYDNRILGDGGFVEEVLGEMEEKEGVELRIINLEELLKKIQRFYKISKEELIRSRVKEVREARNIFIYIGNKYLGKSLTELGGVIGISQSASSRAFMRGKEIFEKKKLYGKII